MEVELPDGRIAEFPDDMPHDQISSILRQQFPMGGQQSQPSTPMDMARQQVQQQHPRMPDWLREGLLSMSSQEPNKALEMAGGAAGHFNRAFEGTGIPALNRGVLSGLSAPIRFGANVANFGAQMAGSDSISALEGMGRPLPPVAQGAMPQVPGTDIQIPVAPTAEMGGEILGSVMSGGPLFKSLMRGAEAASIPGFISKPVAGAITGSALSPETPVTGAVLGAALPGATAVVKKIPELGKAWNILTKEQKPAAAFDKMLGSHDALDSEARALYKQADEIATTRNLEPIKVDEEALDIAKRHLNPDKDYLELIGKAKDGEYKSLTKIQSDMGKRATKLYSNPNSTQADFDKADALTKARNKINADLRKGVLDQGHADLADARKQADTMYAKKMQTYYNKNLKPTVRNVFTAGKRLRPGQTDLDLLKPFMERSASMDKFLAEHPEMKAEVELAREKQKALERLKPLKNATKVSGFGGGLLKVGEILKDFL